MALNGVRSTNLVSTTLVDKVVGNRSGSTRQIPISDLAYQLANTAPLNLGGSQAPLFATKAQLLAANIADKVSAWVYADPNPANNGIWMWSAAWSWALPLPYSIAEAENSGAGSANAIEATTRIPVRSGMIVLLPIVATTTAMPVTVAFNGEAPFTIKSMTGSDIGPGGLVDGMLITAYVYGAEMRLAINPVDASIVAAAEAEADRAEAAALSVVSYIQSPLKASFFCRGDGNNEDAALSAYFSELVSKQVDGVVDLPVRFASSKNVGAYFGSLSGAGEGRLINSGGTDGLVFDYSGIASGYARPLCLENLELLTETDGLGTAIRYIGSDYINMTQIHSVEWDRVRAYGVDDTKGWHKFAQFRRAVNGVLYNPSSQGRSSFASPGYMSVGLEFLDGCNFFDIYSPIFSWMDTAVKVTNSGQMTEAIRLHGGVIQATQVGFLSDAPGAHHVSDGVHYDVTRVAIWWGADNIPGACDFSFATDNWIIRSEAEPIYDPDLGRVRDFIAILVNSNDNMIAGNQLWVPGGLVGGYNRQANSYGIVIGSSIDANKMGASTISNNRLKGATEPILLRATSKATIVTGNHIDANGNVAMFAGGVRDEGQANVLVENVAVDVALHVTRNAGAGKSNPISEAYTTATIANATGNGTSSTLAPMTVTLNDGGGLAPDGLYTAPISGWYRVDVQCLFKTPNNATSGSITVVAGYESPESPGLAFTYAASPQQGYTHMSGIFRIDRGKKLYVTVLAAGTTKTIDILGGSQNSTRVTIKLERPD